MTYQEYYAKSYNIKVFNTRQPLIKVVSRIRKEIKNQVIIRTPEYIRLIPELVSIAGMTDEQRSDHKTMKTLAPFTKLSPDQRILSSNDIVSLLDENNKTMKIRRTC